MGESDVSYVYDDYLSLLQPTSLSHFGVVDTIVSVMLRIRTSGEASKG